MDDQSREIELAYKNGELSPLEFLLNQARADPMNPMSPIEELPESVQEVMAKGYEILSGTGGLNVHICPANHILYPNVYVVKADFNSSEEPKKIEILYESRCIDPKNDFLSKKIHDEAMIVGGVGFENEEEFISHPAVSVITDILGSAAVARRKESFFIYYRQKSKQELYKKFTGKNEPKQYGFLKSVLDTLVLTVLKPTQLEFLHLV